MEFFFTNTQNIGLLLAPPPTPLLQPIYTEPLYHSLVYSLCSELGSISFRGNLVPTKGTSQQGLQTHPYCSGPSWLVNDLGKSTVVQGLLHVSKKFL